MNRIGRYEIIRELGRGAMGVVYAALDPSIGRTVAIKTIRLRELEDPAARDELRSRLRREARTAGVLSHPGIVTIFDLGEHDGEAFIVMEYVEGQTLERLMKSGLLEDPLRSLGILRQAAEALDYAHGKSIVHRDIKPSNVMVTSDGLVKVTDFGIARLDATAAATYTGTVIGTPHYISPEQARGLRVDGRADQFSLAVTAFQLLTGELPFQGPTITAVLSKILVEEPSYSGTRLRPAIQSVLQAALAKNPADRFDTCGKFVAALEAAWQSTGAGGASDQVPAAASSQFPQSQSPKTASTDPGSQKTGRAPLGSEPALPPTPALATTMLDLEQGNRVVEAVAPSSGAGKGLLTPRRRLFVAGLLAALALVTAGVWMLGRRHGSVGVVPPVNTLQTSLPDSKSPVTPPPADLPSPPRKAEPKHEAVPPPRAPSVPSKQHPGEPREATSPEPVPETRPAREASRTDRQSPREGVVQWSGKFRKNAILVISDGRPSFGEMTGELPGVPVQIEIDTPGIEIRQMPEPANGWRRIILYNRDATQETVKFRWRTTP